MVSIPSLEDILTTLQKEVDGGTGQSIHSIIETAFDIDMHGLPMEYLYAIDDTVLECTQCGWTMPSECFTESESAHDLECDDCFQGMR